MSIEAYKKILFLFCITFLTLSFYEKKEKEFYIVGLDNHVAFIYLH